MLFRILPDYADFSATFGKLVNRKNLSGETTTQYFLKKMELIRSDKIRERDATSCIINGLTDVALQVAAKVGSYETPKALFERYLCSTGKTYTLEKSCHFQRDYKRLI